MSGLGINVFQGIETLRTMFSPAVEKSATEEQTEHLSSGWKLFIGIYVYVQGFFFNFIVFSVSFSIA